MVVGNVQLLPWCQDIDDLAENVCEYLTGSLLQLTAHQHILNLTLRHILQQYAEWFM